MPITITMPRLSDTMEEGTLLKWHVSVGDEVSSGDHLADVETDKATMELQAFDDGKVARLAVDEGKTVPVGNLIAVLAGQGEDLEQAAKAEPEAEPQAKAEAEPEPGTNTDAKSKAESTTSEQQAGGDSRQAPQAQSATATAQAPPKPSGKSGGRVRISPLAQRLAEEHGVDINQLSGSGPDGRIVKRDVLAAAEKGAQAPQPTAAAAPEPMPAAGGPTLEARSHELTSMRKTIAKRLVESKTSIPHFTVTMSIDMDPLMDLRQTLNDQLESQGVKLSVNDFITRAVALSCIEHPLVNASWNGNTIEQHGTVNVGVAVALPEERGGGLVVPVLRNVERMGLRQISQQTRQLAKKAREQGLSMEEMSEGTITLSNLGMFGVEHFEAIINPPQAAILAVGGAIKKPVVRTDEFGDDEIVVGHEMQATLSADHRVVDGAIAAAYLQSFKRILENPAGLLV